MNQTHLDEQRSYWHIQIHREAEKWILHRRKGEDWPEITQVMLLDNY